MKVDFSTLIEIHSGQKKGIWNVEWIRMCMKCRMETLFPHADLKEMVEKRGLIDVFSRKFQRLVAKQKNRKNFLEARERNRATSSIDRKKKKDNFESEKKTEKDGENSDEVVNML